MSGPGQKLGTIQHVLCPLWSFYFTFITRDERFGPALKGGRNDGAVSMWKNVLWVVIDIFPAVGTGLQQRDEDGKQDQTHVHTVNKTESKQTLLERADSKNPLPCSAGVTVSLRLSNDYRPQKGKIREHPWLSANSSCLWSKYINWGFNS